MLLPRYGLKQTDHVTFHLFSCPEYSEPGPVDGYFLYRLKHKFTILKLPRTLTSSCLRALILSE